MNHPLTIRETTVLANVPSEGALDALVEAGVEVTDPSGALRIDGMVVPMETRVADGPSNDQLRDLVDGFEQQNQFLNQEVLDLQATIRSLETREKQVVRNNFNLEAQCYQMKSKYLLLLNHMQSDVNKGSKFCVEF